MKKKKVKKRAVVTPFDRKKNRLLSKHVLVLGSVKELLRLNRDTLISSIRTLDREGIDDIFSLHTIQRETAVALATINRLEKRMERLHREEKENSDARLGDECPIQS